MLDWSECCIIQLDKSNLLLKCIDPFSQVASRGYVYIHSLRGTWVDEMLTDTIAVCISHSTCTFMPPHAFKTTNRWSFSGVTCFVLSCVEAVFRVLSTTRSSDEETRGHTGRNQDLDESGMLIKHMRRCRLKLDFKKRAFWSVPECFLTD